MKRIVNAHSATVNALPWRSFSHWTLSAMTTATLARIATMSTWSKSLPAGVSASKITV